MAEEGRKRSRFDQTEPEPKRRESRFDRRSRSPSARNSDRRRSRSPIERQASDSPATAERKDPQAAAAAAAARINAQIQAKKGIQHVDVPPIRSTASPATVKSPSDPDARPEGEVYEQDGDYIKDIEVNDLRNRYLLTKGATQKMIKEDTGADVTTRGEYYPDKSLVKPGVPPLYLHVTSTTKEGLEKAVAKIEELMKQELPTLVDERRFRRREPEQSVERDEFGRRKWPEEKIPVDLEPIPGFNLRAQVVGHGGAYVKHIQQETRCRVQIKGRGSGFIEHSTGQESDEPMYLHVAGPVPDDVRRARELCEDLLANVRQQYEQFKERGPRRGYGGGDRYEGGGRNGGGRHDSYSSSSYGGYGNNSYGGNSQYGGQQSPAGQQSAMSPTSQAAPGAATTSASDYSAQYAQYYGGQDPYAAYGGYQAYMTMYWQYYGQQQGVGSNSGTPAPATSEAPPPPPGSAPPPPPPGEAPPPPPPSGSPPGGYSAVPPPPGL
ncbi:uncharacterized protein IWZ02DRAFT_472148 [Phyllosticta citriasiana]|uniref:uncharacterized protein n=1 Tax=Phyllosticta citriasiana TaxID=595635 RepID=UPI0030FDC61E